MKMVNPPLMESDATLLDRYATQRDESAFRQLVERHAGMVLGVARRRTQDPALGEEAGQIVFTLLARKAPALRHLPPNKLGGWLHRTALLTAGNLLRSEMRRRLHHQRFASENASPAEGPEETSWAAALPFVDEAIDSLPESDRQLVVQHFYQRRTFRELSTGTGRTEDAVRKRTGRALERLSAFFKRRGVTLSAGAIMSGLGTRVTEATPSGYAAAAAAAAVSKASSVGSLTVISNTLATMAFTKITATAAAVAFLTPLGLHWTASATAPPSTTPETASLPKGKKNPDIIAARAGKGSAASSAALPSSRSAALARFAQELAKVTPPPADEQRLAELQRLAFALPEAELALALQLLRSSATADSALGPVVAALAARWAEFDPAEAMRMTASLPKDLHNSVWSGALQVWSRRDFNAAFAWTCKQPDGEDRNAQLDIVYNDLMKRDPASALTRLAELPTEAKRKQFELWTMEVWRNSDPDGAIAWLTNNGPEENRERAVAQFINDWAVYRPDLAFSYTLKHITNPHKREETVRWSLMQWGMHDPHAAISAVMDLPPELQTPGLARNAGPFIALGDPAACLEAIQKLPAGDFRDTLQIPLINQIAAKDVKKAQEMMATLTSPEGRRQAASNIGRQWLDRDPAAARQWIETSPDISAESRTWLLKEADQK